jgi:hypothetical protein
LRAALVQSIARAPFADVASLGLTFQVGVTTEMDRHELEAPSGCRWYSTGVTRLRQWLMAYGAADHAGHDLHCQAADCRADHSMDCSNST